MKKKSLVLAICMAISTPAICIAQGVPTGIVGLNLGDITTSSYLGQPFKGVIPILFANTDDVSQLKVNLAPHSIFRNIGAERLPFLEDLTFDVSSHNSKPIITVRSSKPLEMPFISLVLEIVSEQGTIYQDYTVLIDPPGYQQNKLSSLAPVQASTKKEITQKLTASTGLKYKVTAGDTLSKIAEALKTSQISLQKMIDVIHQVNPKAFVDNDINRLKSNVYLKIPNGNKINNFKFSLVKSASVNNKETKVTSNTLSKSYTIKQGDSLSAITQKFSHENISFTKRMVAIFNANSHAFSKNRINILKIGETLSIPYATQETSNETVSSDSDVEENTVINSDEPAVKTTRIVDTSIKTETSLNKEVTETSTNSDEPTVEATKNKEIINTSINTETSASEEAAEPSLSEVVKQNNVADNPSSVIFEFEENESTKEDAKDKSSQSNPAMDTEDGIVVGSISVIGNLEKRVRELRHNLSTSKSKLSYLEDILLTRDIEIRKKTREINSLSTYLKEELGQEELKTIENELENATETTEVISNPEEQLESLSITDTSPTYFNVNQDNDIVALFKSLSFSDISYGFLALLLSLGLITYRKELHSYAIASEDYPKFYPPEGNAIVPDNNDIKTDDHIIQIKTNGPEVDSVMLDECDKLIDELTNELQIEAKDSAKNTNKEWKTLEKICNDYIEKHQEDQNNDPLTGINLNAQIEDAEDVEEHEPETQTSFEDMVTELIENLEDKSTFDESNPLINSRELVKI